MQIVNRLVPTLLLAVAACGRTSSDFEPVADVRELMRSVVEPAADVYWDAVGWIADTTGTYEIVPQSGAEWEAVRSAAVVVTESGNLLMMQGRGMEGKDWTALSRALVAVGRTAIDAAEKQDRDAVFRVGGDIYEVCTACHATFALETLRPSDARK